MGKKGMKLIALLLTLVMLMGVFAGCSTKNTEDTAKEASKPQEAITKEYDVVVVGAGAAGLAAAIEAAEQGAKVAVLEKMPMVGGSTVLSGGIVYGTGSELHKKAGVEDSVEELVKYWSERAEGQNDIEQLTFVAERSGQTIDWLVKLGVQFGNPAPTGTSPVPRAVTSTEHGAGIIKPLKTYAESKNVEFFMQTEAKDLITNDKGEVVGVKAVDKEKNDISFMSKAVVLATGGFDRNPELVKKYATVAEGQSSFAGTGNSGDGLIMAEKLNADVVTHGGVIGFRTVEGEPAYTTDVCMLMWMPYLSVNKQGQRFVNEAIDYPLFYEELVKQEDKVSYLIFDGNTYNPTLDKAVEKGSAFVADSLEELAQKAGINAEGLNATVKEYNEMVKTGKDTKFGKDLTGHAAIEKPKYYALKVVPAILGTMTGVKTNLDTQVIDKSGNVISGLYAAGEVANGDFFNTIYPASGTSIQMGLTFGRVAGTNAAKHTGK
ncbi:MAG: fumarate reductase/succinate dehydrogenase flavoprotein domain protein [Clostridia bacterium]|jgi:fumarate reductase flavoprotein subunit|nr:fumarate reductase/succinate dehydrogenase flavoprotein domain protein [Clostridia bacterium]